MIKKKLLIGLGGCSLFLASCSGDTSTAEETNSSSEQIEQTENTKADQQEEVNEENADQTTEEISNNEGELPSQQPGDVIEAEAGTRTIVATNYGINETQESGPFEITVTNAQVSHMETEDESMAELLGGNNLAMVTIQVEVTNNSEETNIIHPGQGTIVTNNGDQVDSNIWLSDDVGGDFLGEVTKSGDVFFFYEGNPEEVQNVRYIIGSGHDENYENFGEDPEFSIDF